MPAPKYALTKNEYDAMLGSLRQTPHSMNAAAKAAGVSWQVAKNAFEGVYEEEGYPAIRDVLTAERRSARAALRGDGPARPEEMALLDDRAKRELEEQQASREHAVKVREAEGKMIEAVRGNVLGLLAKTGRMTKSMLQEVDTIEAALQSGKDPSGKPLTLDQRLKYLSTISRIVKSATESARHALEMERLVLGQPTEILGVDVNNMTPADAAATIDLAGWALRRARESGKMPPMLIDADGEAAE